MRRFSERDFLNEFVMVRPSAGHVMDRREWGTSPPVSCQTNNHQGANEMWTTEIDGLEQGGPPPAAAAVGMGERPSSSDDVMCCKVDSSVREDADAW